jgi:heterodisulfide reductase subunit C2
MNEIAIDGGLDVNFKYEIAGKPGGENIKKCFACGTCTAGCPVYHVEHKYNPRKIIRMILLGMREQVLSSKEIWLCSQCYTCSANCPQDVDFSDIVFALREMAVREGHAPSDRQHRIAELGNAANVFRRDCINMLLDEGEVTEEQMLSEVKKTIEQIKGEI